MPDKEKKKAVKAEEAEEKEIESSDEEVEVKTEIEHEKESFTEEIKKPADVDESPENEIRIGDDDDKSSPYFTNSNIYAGSSTSSTQKSFSGKRLVFFLVAIAVSAAIFFAGLMFFKFQFSSIGLTNPFAEATPTPTPEPTSTPTPTPEINLSDYSVQVLNGSGVSGAAAAVASLLEEEGFEGVEVGNAADEDYEETEVQLAEGVPSEVYSIISSALSEYTVVEGAELDEDAEFDIIIVVGQVNSSGDDEDVTPTPEEEEE